MGEESLSNSYEEARKKHLLDNQKRFEDLGISKISKSLSDLSKSEKKYQQRQVKPKLSINTLVEPRRSSRERTLVPSYRDEVDIGLPPLRKRSKFNSSYITRPLDEIKIASYEERVCAMNSAEKLQSSLQSDYPDYPSFVKSMVRSHVYSCFWLGLPTWFCADHLPKSTVDMVLEDEDGNEYDAVFISKRTGLSGGWRGFALDHKLDDGDALVFELVEPTRFKVYIVKASNDSSQDDGEPDANEGDTGDAKKNSKGVKNLNERSDDPKSSTKSQNSKRLKKLKAESHEAKCSAKSDETEMSARYSTRTRSRK